MPYQIACDNCHHVLRIPDHVTDVVLTCPRCLAKVVNPEPVLRTARPTSAPPPLVEPAPAASTCPACGRDVETTWRFCPSCNRALQAPETPPTEWTASPDADVRFDTRGTLLGLVILAALGGVGVGLFFLGGGFDLVRDIPGGTAIAGVGVLFLVIALTAVFLLRTPETRAPAGVARGFLGGCAVTATVGVVLLALIAAAAVSAVLTFVETCSKACGLPPAQKNVPGKR